MMLLPDETDVRLVADAIETYLGNAAAALAVAREAVMALDAAGRLALTGGITRTHRGRGAATAGLHRRITTYPDGYVLTSPWSSR